MRARSERHRVAVVASPGVLLLDLAIPLQAFSFPPYIVGVHGQGPIAVGWRTLVSVTPTSALRASRHAHTLVVPGYLPVHEPPPAKLVETLRDAHDRGARIGSICTGAFALGYAGLLDDHASTTHWLYRDTLAELFPATRVAHDRSWIVDGRIATCGTPVGAMELCLSLIADDLGIGIATERRRMLAMDPTFDEPPRRQGGSDAPAMPSRTAATQEWCLRRLERPLTLADMAEHAGTSPRSFSRWFLAENGTTPIQWLQEVRVARARELLESTSLTISEIARLSGMGTRTNFRRHFIGRVGVTPKDYRRSPRA